MFSPWMSWATSEGIFRTVSRLLQKYVGIAGRTFTGAVMSIFVVGVVQMLGGLVYQRASGSRLRLPPRQMFSSLLFGAIATAMSVLGVWVFTYPGADVGITTFIFTMSIVPGAFLDWAFFGNRPTARQWLGIAVFLVAGYAILNYPSAATLMALPRWVWLAAVIALLAAINQALAQALSSVKVKDPLVANFWIGATTTVLSGITIPFLIQAKGMPVYPPHFWVGSAAIGLAVILLTMCNILSYRWGGTIAAKKLIMQGTYLALAVLLGAAFYAEPITTGKIIGIAGFVAAFALMNYGRSEKT